MVHVHAEAGKNLSIVVIGNNIIITPHQVSFWSKESPNVSAGLILTPLYCSFTRGSIAVR